MPGRPESKTGQRKDDSVKDIEILTGGRMMPLITDQLDAAFTVHKLPPEPERDEFLAEIGPRIRGMATGGHVPTDAGLMGRLPSLEIVANFGVGYDTVDAAWAGKHGIVVTNTPDVLTDEVADTTFGLLLMTVRELSKAEAWLRQGRWEKEGPYPLTHGTLRGKHVGIVGLGRIGKVIAARCVAFGLSVSYHGRSRQADVPYPYVGDLIELARESDILISVAPGGSATYRMIGKAVFEALGPQGVFINVGRGSTVDEAALAEALRSRTIFAAGLDVFEHEPHVPAEFLSLDNVVLLPHVGSATHHTRGLMGQLVVDNLTSWFGGKGPVTPVAETPWPRR
jgi:lactate dehydrogenase-like 2-hydroxyacid dehydrogenase